MSLGAYSAYLQRMRIVSWNVNSIRIRLPQFARLVACWNPDIVCLQETKVEDGLFPLEAISKLGFVHCAISGQKSYNGVAILSKIPLKQVRMQDFAGLDHRRHIAAALPDGTQLHNFYIPAGGDIPDVNHNPAYAAKLRFVEEMQAWAREESKKYPQMIALGDFNIAPLEHDVWSHKQLLDVVSHTPPETERLRALQEGIGWCDSGRHFTPPEEKLYSWWSYRSRDWQASNRGRRLDHIWVTKPLVTRLEGYHSLVEARSWPSPSDHIPIAIDVRI